MKITTSGQGLQLSKGLQTHIEEILPERVGKYFDKIIDADVVISKESKFIFCTSIFINEGTGGNINIKSRATDEHIYVSFDKALDKIEKQLRRYKRKLKNHNKIESRERDEILGQQATKYVIPNNDEEQEANNEDNLLIIAEKQSKIDKMTVSDAVMHMNLQDLPALMFINKKTNNINVVYHREDGNISWIDAKLPATENISSKAA